MVAIRIKGLLLLPILTKTLGPEQYGIYSLIIVSLSILIPLITLKLDFALVRFLSNDQNKKLINQKFLTALSVILSNIFIVSVALYFFSEIIALTFFDDVSFVNVIKISIPLILLSVTKQVFSEYLRALEKMKKFTTLQLSQTFGEIILTPIFLYKGYGLSGAIFSLLIVRIIGNVLVVLWIKSNFKFSKPNFDLLKPFFLFSLPLLPVSLGHILIGVGDRYLIGYFLGSANVGIYSASYSLGLLVSFVFAPIPLVLFPIISKLYDQNNVKELKKHLSFSLKYFLLFAIPSVFGLTILSKNLLKTFTTELFLSGQYVVPIIGLSILIYNSSDLNNQIILLTKKTKISARINIITLIINLVLNIVLIPIYELNGAAIATLITYTFHFYQTRKYGYKKIRYKIEIAFIIKCIFSSVVMAISILFLINNGLNNMLFLFFFGIIIYFIFLLSLKGISKNEISQLRKISSE